MDITWGGYYASKINGESEFSVFRLLDFTREASHVALFASKFASQPSIEEVIALVPDVLHAPLETKSLLLHDQLILVGGKPLTLEDLVGYRHYLSAHQIPDEMIEEHFAKLVHFSGDPPLLARLENVEGELVITEREPG